MSDEIDDSMIDSSPQDAVWHVYRLLGVGSVALGLALTLIYVLASSMGWRQVG